MATNEVEERQRKMKFLEAPLHEVDVNFVIEKNKIDIIAIVIISGVVGEFDPIELCELLIKVRINLATESKTPEGQSDFLHQALLFSELNTFIVGVIKDLDRFIDVNKSMNSQLKHYDFTNTYRVLDAQMERAKFHLDLKLLNSQIKANQSQIEANRNANKINISISIFTLVAAVYYGFEICKDAISDTNEYKWPISIGVSAAILIFGIASLLNIGMARRNKV